MGTSWIDQEWRRRDGQRRRWPWVALAALGGLAWLARRELRWAAVVVALVVAWVVFGR